MKTILQYIPSKLITLTHHSHFLFSEFKNMPN